MTDHLAAEQQQGFGRRQKLREIVRPGHVSRDARGHPQREGLPLLEERAGGEEIASYDLIEDTLTVPKREETASV